MSQQLLSIDCKDVGGRSPETAIPLQQFAYQPDRYDLMLRYARCCFGAAGAWCAEHEERAGRSLECLVIITADEREQRLWFDVTPESN